MENPRKKTTVATPAGGDELQVFDHQQQQGYALNTTSALVLQHCDGQTTPKQLMELLRQNFNVSPAQAEQLTWLALDELGEANLLEAECSAPTPTVLKPHAPADVDNLCHCGGCARRRAYGRAGDDAGQGPVSPQWDADDLFLKGKGIYSRSY